MKLEIKQMKLNAKSQVDVPPKTIYTNSRTVLTDKGHNLEDLKQANFPLYNKCYRVSIHVTVCLFIVTRQVSFNLL